MAEQADDLPTPRSTLRSRYACVLVWCKSCRHQREADLQALVNSGRGRAPEGWRHSSRTRLTSSRNSAAASFAMRSDNASRRFTIAASRAILPEWARQYA